MDSYVGVRFVDRIVGHLQLLFHSVANWRIWADVDGVTVARVNHVPSGEAGALLLLLLKARLVDLLGIVV